MGAIAAFEYFIQKFIYNLVGSEFFVNLGVMMISMTILFGIMGQKGDKMLWTIVGSLAMIVLIWVGVANPWWKLIMGIALALVMVVNLKPLFSGGGYQ